MLSALSLLLLLGVSVSFGVQDFSKDVGVQQLSKANYDFSIDLYKYLAKRNTNLVVSGYSVSSVLAMLLEGSRGKSAEELLYTLKYFNMSPRTVQDAYKKVIDALKGNGTYDLTAANSLWVEKSFEILGDYRQKLLEVYQAEAKVLSLPTGKDDVNAWVSEKTNGLIPDLLKDELSQDTVLLLANAIFFKGTWETKFDNKTFEAGFIDNDMEIPADDYKSPTTRMMSTKGKFLYTRSNELEAEIIDLPYQGNDVSLTIILPGWKLARLEAALTTEKLQKAISELKTTDVKVVMPVFKIENEHNLKEALNALGVEKVFSSAADLSGINPSARLQVSGVVQKALVEVDVEGTKAAAATGLTVTTKSMRPTPKYIDFRATHPFMFVIRHKATNTILFTGRFSQSTPYSE